MKKEFKEKYYCSVHGGEGNPECEECWKNLYELAKDNDTLVIGP